MGNFFSKCLKKKNKKAQEPSLMHVFPNQHEEKNYETSPGSGDNFYFIPNENNLNKTIEYLDELPILTEKDIQKLDESLIELQSIRKKHKSIRFSTNFSRSDSISKQIPEYPSQNSLDNKSRQSISAGISLQNINEAPKKPYLLIGVDSAKFMHEETMSRHNLKTPFVIVKIYKRDSIRTPLFSSNPGDEVKAFMTGTREEKLNPVWNEFVSYELPIEAEEKQGLTTFSIGFSLYYILEKNETTLEIGSEQHFSLSSLLDQKVQTKIIEFKDSVLKGSLARLTAKFQLIHDENQVKEKLVNETEMRIEKLLKIREKHMPGFQNRPHSHTFMNSMRQVMDNGQSVLSVYSNGMMDSDYYIAM